MPRTSRKNAILQAAERVCLAAGAARLTLDRVAEEAGISKGGLLYHFPDRRSLLTGLVAHHLDRFEAGLQATDDRTWAQSYLRHTLQGREAPVSAALLAVAAEDPTLLAPLAVRMTAWRARMRRATSDPVAAETLMLAADAVWYAGLLGLPNCDPGIPDHLSTQLARLFDDP